MFGDPKVIVDWANGISTLQVSLLDHWFGRTMQLMDKFISFFIKHVFQELSVLVDELSKKVVGDIEGPL